MNATLKEREVLTPIEHLIRERGLRPGWVAEKSGVSYMRLRDLRLGLREAKASELVRLSRVFGVPMEVLVSSSMTHGT